ncbi:hypothetical protein PYCCODRAFT_784638 [Trametes coccinea BRFM310]|uniref:Uncharacterized protein n=1 Tax=Trametes coccinea (strain BRFM310) TaxID=1353009 RepID=A0A1Y2J0X9_TRAC3|nr:hypothetical protein PYCCODRAFT_784638 [Trametes coccinea BRFM310]
MWCNYPPPQSCNPVLPARPTSNLCAFILFYPSIRFSFPILFICFATCAHLALPTTSRLASSHALDLEDLAVHLPLYHTPAPCFPLLQLPPSRA